MRHDRIAGIALIIGSLAGVITMALHPTGGSPERVMKIATIAFGVHVLAIIGVWIQAVGFLRFSLALRPGRPLVDAGLVAFLLALVTVTLAAIASGMMSVELAERALDAEPAEQPIWRVAMVCNFLVNGIMAQIYIVAFSVSVLFWSLSLLRISTAWKILGGAGVLVSGAGLVAQISGHLQHNVHDFGLYVFATAAWTIALGALLCLSTTKIDDVAVQRGAHR